MSGTRSHNDRAPVFKQNPDAAISQNNPVSDTEYPVLTVQNARIISMTANLTWAVTQPTALVIKVVVDGVTVLYGVGNPVSATNYLAYHRPYQTDGILGAIGDIINPFLFEGRSIAITVYCTWAVTQPTPLVCRVKYATL